MRVLLASQFYPPVVGGEEQMVASLAGALARRGHDVAVVTLGPHAAPAVAADGPVRVHRLEGITQRLRCLYSDPSRRHAPPFPDPGIVHGLRRVIAQERPDVVHAHNWIAHSLLPALPAGLPLAVTLHDYSLRCATKRLMRSGAPCEGPHPSRCLPCGFRHYGVAKGAATVAGLAASSRRLRRRTSLFVAISTATADLNGLRRDGLPHRVVPNFLPDREEGVPDERLLDRLPGDGFIMFAGDLYPDKGVGVLLEAHAGLGPAAPPLVMIGRRPPALAIPPGQRVWTPGPWDHATLMAAWRRCTVAVVPSVWPEPFGLVALEAMSAGAALVASRTGGLADVVVDGASGLLVPPGDPAALAAALRGLLADPARRGRLGAEARRRAADFDEDAIVPQIEAAYAAAIAGRPV
jgi:glycosyltransferase involved in cell wall biosynthesis